MELRKEVSELEETTEPKTEKKGMNPMIIVGIVVIVGVIGLVAMQTMNGSSSNTQPSTNSTDNQISPSNESMKTETTPGAAMEGDSDMSDVRIIDMEAGAFYYKPNEIRVKKGEKIKIVMKSVDMMHDFNIDELGVKIPIAKSGETGTVEFTADKAGTFEYYCSVGQHRKNGQVGTLIVE